MRFKRNLVLLVVFGLVVAACSDDSVTLSTTTAATTTTTTATTTSTFPPTTITSVVASTTTRPQTIDFYVKIEAAVVFEEQEDGSCAGIKIDGEDFTYLTEGEPVIVEIPDSGEQWQTGLSQGHINQNEYGLRVCEFEAKIEGMPTGRPRYMVRLTDDTRGIVGEYVPGENFGYSVFLLYPHGGVENGLGYNVVPWELYPTGVPVWHSDMAKPTFGYNAQDDGLRGIGFDLPAGTQIKSPLDGTQSVFTWDYFPTYVGNPPEGIFAEVLTELPARRGGSPDVRDRSMFIRSIQSVINRATVLEIGIAKGDVLATTRNSSETLPFFVEGLNVELEFGKYISSSDGYWAWQDILLTYFPYLDTHQPVREWEMGLTLVGGADCDLCVALRIALEDAPSVLPIYVVDVGDEVPRFYVVREVPTLVVETPSYGFTTRSGQAALDDLDALIEKACRELALAC